MKRSAIYSLAVGTAMAGSMFLGTTGAQATTQHCDLGAYPSKVEVDAGPTYNTGLPEGTEVCIKAGTQTAIVYVDSNGYITNDAIFNWKGNARGISYYAYGECPIDPYTNECE